MSKAVLSVLAILVVLLVVILAVRPASWWAPLVPASADQMEDAVQLVEPPEAELTALAQPSVGGPRTTRVLVDAIGEATEDESRMPVVDGGVVGGTVRVEVREHGTGDPAPGVVVELFDETVFKSGVSWNSVRHQSTDREGLAIFAAVTPGEAHVSVLAAAMRGAEMSASVTVMADEISTLGFRVDGTRRLQGRVVDLTGRRIAGAVISVQDSSMRDHVVAVSRVDGTFEVAYVETPSLLIATSRGYGASNVVLWRGTEASDEEVILTLTPRRGRVFGRVVDSEVEPVDGAHVALTFFPQEGSPRIQFARSTADGSFDFPDAAVGVHYLEARVPGAALTKVTLNVTDGASLEEVLAIREGGVLAGQVTEPDGAALVGAMVGVRTRLFAALGQTSATTDADGRFELPGQSPGEVPFYVKSAESEEVAQATLIIVDGQVTEWNPVAMVRGPLHGHVRSSDGSVLAGWSVRTQPMRGPESYDSWKVGSTDETGLFEVIPFAGSTFRLRVGAPGASGARFALEVVDVSLDAVPLDLVVPESRVPSGTLTGRLVNSDRQPVSDRVTLVVDGEFYPRGKSTNDGRFQIPYVPEALPEAKSTLYVGLTISPEFFLADVPPIASGEIYDVGDVIVEAPR